MDVDGIVQGEVVAPSHASDFGDAVAEHQDEDQGDIKEDASS